MGVLICNGGFYGNVFRIAPPLCFTKEDASRSFYTHIVASYHLLYNVNISCVSLVSDYLVDVMDYSMTKK